MNIQPEKAPSQIDYILVSTRWATGSRSCKTSWGLPITIHGRKYDHALIKLSFKIRLKCDRRRVRKDFAALNTPDVQESHNDAIRDELAKTPRPDTAEGRLSGSIQQC